MPDLKRSIRDVPDFPRPGILFRDIAPLLRDHFDATLTALDALLTDQEWREIDALAGIESRGFILGAALALRRGKGFVPVRKQGKSIGYDVYLKPPRVRGAEKVEPPPPVFCVVKRSWLLGMVRAVEPWSDL